VLAELDDQPPAASPTGKQHLPLAGVRVLDLSMFFAGPVAAQVCADAGADVVKVESLQRIDGWRGAGTGGTGDLPSYEGSPYFNWVNRGKRDITLNLKDPRAVAVLKTMVKDADILIENYTPRVMSNFGLDYDVLKAINPRLIMLSLSGFGADTSWRDYVAFGMSTEQMSGLSHLTGYEDGEPIFTGTTGGDLFAGIMGATTLMAAIHHRHQTGAGQHINLSQLEACNLYLGDAVTGWSLAGVDPGRTGNRHASFEPQGIYPCAGDSWIGLTCKTDEQWRTLATAVGRADLQDFALMHQLQEQGVPAGAVMRGPELLADPHLAARHAFLAQDRPGVGVKHYPNQPYRFASAGESVPARAPLLGEHLSEVLTELGGLSDDDIAELIIDDVVGTVPIVAR
jgi:crotonobetainyl-CoA:carnitine CoA-transferase CaiB-like acyl-CoA transferase